MAHLTTTVPFGTTRRITRHELDNGLVILTIEEPRAPVVTYHTWFGVGSAWEQPGKTGMAHLFEHLMFKETTNHPAGEFDRLIERSGGSTNAATWLDWTYYRDSVPVEALPLVIELEADRLANMIIDAPQLEAERSVVMNERRLRVENDPDGELSEVLFHRHFGDHPYGHPTIGWMEDIEGFTLEDARAFHRTYYAPNNAVIVVVGDVDTDDLVARLEAAYGGLAPTTLPAAPPGAMPARTGEVSFSLDLHLANPRLVYAYPAPDIKHPDAFALEVLSGVLFGGRSARVYRRMVTDEEVALWVGGWVANLALTGMFEMDVLVTSAAHTDTCRQILDEEIDRVVAEGVTATEREGVINRLEASLLRDLDINESRARLLGTLEVSAGDFSLMTRLVEAYQAVTLEDVQRVAATYLKKETRTVAHGAPIEEVTP